MSNINKDYTLQIKLKEGKTIPENVYFGFVYYKDEMSTSASADWLLTSENGLNTKLGNGTTYALTTFNPSVYYQDGICCYPASQENWDSIMDAFEINLVEGSYHSENIPEYTPYGKYRIPIKLTNENGESTTTNIYLDEPLRKVEDSADYIDFKTGTVVRNVGEKILDGTERWNKWNNTWASTVLDSVTSAFSTKVLNTHYAPATIMNSSNLSNYETYMGGGSSKYYIRDDDYSTDSEFKSFLEAQYNAGTPVTAYYPLVPSSNNYIDLPDLLFFEDYTKMEVLTETKPSKIEVEYIGYTLD